MQEQLTTENQISANNEGKKLGLWKTLWGIIRYPDRTFEQTGGRASLLFPILLVFIGMIFNTVSLGMMQSTKMIAELQKGMARNPGMPSEIIDQITGFATSPVFLTASAVGVSIVMLITWLIQSGILHFFMKALGGTGVFRQAFGIMAWSWVPVFIGSVVKVPYAIVTGRLPGLQDPGLFNVIIKNLDPFSIWNVILLIIGFSVVYSVKKSKAVVPIVGIWLIGILIESAGLLLK